MTGFNEVLSNIEDENINRDSHTHFTYTDPENESIVRFTVSKSTDLVYNGETIEFSVVLSFNHTKTKVTCSMNSTAIQYAVLSFADSELLGNLGIKLTDKGFFYGNEEFPGTPDEFKEGFAKMLKHCDTISVEADTVNYPIERLILGSTTQTILDFEVGDLDEDMVSAACDLLRPIYNGLSDELPKRECVDFVAKSIEPDQDSSCLFEELVDIYCDMYFDLHGAGDITPSYLEKLKSVQNKNFSLICTQGNVCSLVFGNVLAYVSTILQSNHAVNDLRTEIVVPTANVPFDLSSIIIHTLD